METVRVFLVVFCFIAGFGGGVSGSGIVSGTGGYEKRYSSGDISWGRYDAGSRSDGRGARSARAGAVIKAAQGEIGVREDSENAGKRVDQFNAYVGFKKAAWCASFCSWAFGQAGYSAPRTAWSPALFPAGRCRTVPLPGMIIGIYFPSLGRIGHCGILERLQGEFIISVEGNTNVAGSREGDGIYRRMRHRRTIAKFAEWL